MRKIITNHPEIKLVVHIIKTESAEINNETDQKKERIKEVELEIPIKESDSVGTLQKKLKVNNNELLALVVTFSF